MWIRKNKVEKIIRDIYLEMANDKIINKPKYMTKYPDPINVYDEYGNIIIDNLTYLELVNYVIRGKDITRDRPKVILKGGDKNRPYNESSERAL